MSVGRKLKPTALKIIEGNPNKARINKREPKAKGNLSSPPRHLTSDQKKDWRWVIKHAPLGVLKNIDSSVLEIWVVAYDIYKRAVKAVNEEGMVVLSPQQGVPMQSPHLATVNRQALIMLKAAAEMGFTPASRGKVSVDTGDDDDPISKFEPS